MADPGGTPGREWWTRPGVILPVVGSIVLIVALFTPQAASGRFGDPRLSSHLANALGARVLHDMATRLGWRTLRSDSVAAPTSFDGHTIHAVLAPVTPVLPAEAHAYLQAVRGGDALLLVLQGRTPLSDSLGVACSLSCINAGSVKWRTISGHRLRLTRTSMPSKMVKVALLPRKKPANPSCANCN